MPELPDLQVFSQNLHKKLKGKKLETLNIPVTKKLKTPAKKIKEALEGSKLSKVFRDGKELHFKFDNGEVLGLHLMLHGALTLFTKKNDQKSTVLELLFADGTGLAMTDYQKQATPTLNPEPRDAPDAMSKAVNLQFMKAALQVKTIIKTLLLDQHVIRGIGNAYADEILWHAKISPFSVSNKIPVEKIKVLLKSIRSVLSKAEKQILKHDPETITGEYRDFLDIHHAKKTVSPTGKKILKKEIGGRKTYYTEEQELY